ncbi:dihydroorotate dehydrogenase B (NAD(+)), catalytic subunit [bacterium BMS3Abin07]|nr:dihydroorotate dehydrogenase B (NAD(+)), catalytic subunit [bacterium BMS3Abin07]GBE31987.1 dihydroorotate dehydrogenase B (NAD(+)), catalytic subunit [bacterium BMS3Bbin05]HDZ88502.1 dihydroorotate dehydrogenase [Nitrospirota bacterium]
MKLDVKIGKMQMKNPVMTASGTFGYGQEYAEFFDLSELGAINVKGISLNPMAGNPAPRICETPCGMINSIGLQNVGLEGFLSEKLPYLRNFRTNIVANVLGNTIDEYIEISERLDSEDIDAIELNVSCPNVKQGGISFGVDFLQLRKLLMAVRSVVKKKTLIVKLSPNVTDIRIFARTAEDEGADAVSMINTVMAMSINVKTRKSRIASMIGGLSGPAIRPVAVRMVWEVHNAVKIPIIGMGGIMTYEDALEFILAGATSVAVGTANFIDPISSLNIINGMREYMSINNVADIHDLIGGVNE